MARKKVEAHQVHRTLDEIIAYPEHDPRRASAEYKKVHNHLVYELDEPCWICGVRQSLLPNGEHMETHHAVLEWALEGAASPELVMADFPAMGGADDPHLREWLDSEGNMLVLCQRCHRGARRGIHMITYPAWIAQRYLDGHDITGGNQNV
jgi:hypothetical protein